MSLVAVPSLPKDPLPRRGVRKVLVCFTGAALGYCDYLVSWEKNHGNPRANRSDVIRKSLRARQIIRHDLRGTLGNLRLVREMLLADAKPTPQSNAGIADVIEAIHDQLSKLTDPEDPEPLAGHIKAS